MRGCSSVGNDFASSSVCDYGEYLPPVVGGEEQRNERTEEAVAKSLNSLRLVPHLILSPPSAVGLSTIATTLFK